MRRETTGELMSYATLLVHVGLESETSGHVAVAADLARRFDAHLIGAAGWAPMSMFLAEAAKLGRAPQDRHLEDMKTLLAQAGGHFCAAVGKAGVVAQWRSALDYPTEVMAREARAADLVIVDSAREGRDPFRALDPGALILKAGRPVLVVPPSISALSPRRIAIAWKDTREARRAVSDALPFLRQAESVMVVAVCEERGGEEAAREVKDVADYLTRHRVATIAERVRPADVTVGAALLRLIREENIDLVVAGAYGHSRLGEWAFGGTTRDLLGQDLACTLFSH